MMYLVPEHLGLSTRTLARQVGCSRREAEQWLRDGMTWTEADRFACALGLHPTSLWGDWDMPLWRWLRAWALEESWALRSPELRALAA